MTGVLAISLIVALWAVFVRMPPHDDRPDL